MSIPIEEILGITAGTLTSVSALPQLIKIIKEKEAKDVSLKMLLVLVTGVCMWIAYGIFKSDIPIIATNGLSLLLNSTVIFFKVKYGKR